MESPEYSLVEGVSNHILAGGYLIVEIDNGVV